MPVQALHDIGLKIAVTSTGKDLDSHVEPRFGRCPYFIIVDLESMQFEAIRNSASDSVGGAGIRVAQIIASKGAKVLITGNVGLNAFQALSSAGIQVITGAYGTVKEVIEKYKRGELRATDTPTTEGQFRMAGGRGRGWR